MICLINFQTIYFVYTSLIPENTIEIISATESENEPCENEADETESTEFLIHNNKLSLSNLILTIFYNNNFSFIISSFHQKVPIPPPER